MGKTVFLIVDVQTAIVEGHPYNEAEVINNIKILIDEAHKNNIEIVYVRHDDGTGSALEKGTTGWQIYYKIEPGNNELIFDKRYNSAFKDTGLHEYLMYKGADHLILTGLQTEYCIDTTCKTGFELGYSIIIPQSTTSTFDNDYFKGKELAEYYEEKIWKNRFAKIMNMTEVINYIRNI